MRYLRPLLAGAVLTVLLSSTASPAYAAGEIATRISIGQLETLTVGSEASVVVTLAQEDGVAVVDEPIALTIDGDSRSRRWTDAAGVATFHLPRDLPPGEHEVVATYAGRRNAYLGATARTVVDIVPYELAIETVPSLPGMVFEIDGARFEAGADGVARVGLDRLGDHTLTAVPSAYRHAGQRVEFSRWSNETFGPTVSIRAPLEVSLQAGFDVSFQASLAFMDPHGNRVDDDRIEEVTLRNSIGAEVTDADGRPRWYKAIRTIRRPAGLDSVPIRYTVERVIVDGENVVNVGQQRFDVEPGVAWPIELLLYSVRMVPNDALFGFPLGESVILTYPSGSTTRIDAVDGEFAAEGLARGLYRVQLADAPGWSPVTPIALSRDQEVRVRVITYLDMAVVILTGIGVALGLLHLGRPHLAPAAMAGAKGAVGVARSPRTIGALFARRRTAATPATEMAPAVVTPREFVLPPVRPERSSAGHSEPHYAPPPARASAPGTVPIAQVIRTTLGTPLPASRPEAAALPPPPPVLTTPRAAEAPTPIPQPAPAILAPSLAVANSPGVDANETAPQVAAPVAAATGEAALPSAPTGDKPRKPRRTRSSEGATATKPPRRARRTEDTSSGRTTTTGDVATPKGRRATRARKDGTIVPEVVTQPQTAKPARPKAPRKRTSASTEADAESLRPRVEHLLAPWAPHTSAQSTPANVEPSGAKGRKSRAKTVARLPTNPKPPKTVGTSKKPRATTKATAGARPPKPRATTKTTAGARPPKPRATTKATAAARPLKPRAAKRSALKPDVTASADPTALVSDALAVRDTPSPPTAPEQTSTALTVIGASTAGAALAVRHTPSPPTAPEQTSTALTVIGASTPARPSKPRSAKKSGSPPDVTAIADPTEGVSDALAVHDTPPPPTPPEQTSTALTVMGASTAARPSKRGSAKRAATAERPPKRSAKNTAAGARSRKRSAEEAAILPEVIALGTADGSLPDAPVRGTPELPTASEQTPSTPTATDEPADAVVAIDGTSPPPDQTTDSTTTSIERVSEEPPVRVGQPPAEQMRSKQVELIASVARVLPYMPALSERLARRQAAAAECSGCGAVLKPGARFCRRCGHVTAVGELEKERLS